LKHFISIVLPCFNPITNWDKNILDNYKLIKKSLPEVTIEIILVNDGSSIQIEEGSIIYLRTEIQNFKYLSYSVNKGKGYAVREGVKNASFDNVVFTDIDFPYTTDSFVNMTNKLFNEEGDIVVGVRNVNYYENVPFYRKLISKGLIKLNKILLNLPVGETQAGLKAFSEKGKNALLKSTINGYLFDIEVLKIAHKNGCVIKTSPVELRKDIVFSTMKFSLLMRELLNYFKILFSRN
jgi:glycosyltransferase involved in cell wall biosynthesis